MRVLLVALLVVAATSEQESHLSRLVRAEGKSLEFVVRPLTEPQSVERLALASDLIVFGKVGDQLRAYVTESGTDVMTDYHVDVKDVVFSASGDTSGAAISALTLSQLGGTAAVAGHTVTMKHRPLELLGTGSDVLLFLKREGEQYRIVNDDFGVFLVSDGVLTPATPATSTGRIEPESRFRICSTRLRQR